VSNFIAFIELRSFIHKIDFVHRTRTEFYIILDNLKQMILCCMNVHIHILEIRLWWFISEVFFKPCMDNNYVLLTGIY